jgi:hypothetical protein
VLEKLKQRWQIESNTQIIIVFIVFAITGFSVLIAKKLIYSLIGVSPDWAWYIRFPIWIATILPTYYALLLFFGTIFGQKTFFFWFAKKSLGRFGRKKEITTTNSEVD